jgi:hypothetical protein
MLARHLCCKYQGSRRTIRCDVQQQLACSLLQVLQAAVTSGVMRGSKRDGLDGSKASPQQSLRTRSVLLVRLPSTWYDHCYLTFLMMLFG